MKKKFNTHYDNLQVKENASLEVIRGAYRYLSQKWHPDKNADNREEAARVTRIINAAYEVLSDPQRRKEHDDWITVQRQAHQENAKAERTRQVEPEEEIRETRDERRRRWGLAVVEDASIDNSPRLKQFDSKAEKGSLDYSASKKFEEYFLYYFIYPGFAFIFCAFAIYLGYISHQSNEFSRLEPAYASVKERLGINVRRHCAEKGPKSLEERSRFMLWIMRLEHRSDAYSYAEGSYSALVAHRNFTLAGDGDAASEANFISEFRSSVSFEIYYIGSLCVENELKSRGY